MTGVPSIDMRVSEFLAFLDRRSDVERWELVGGMPIMMTPPASPDERIALPDLGDIGTLAAAYRGVCFS